MRGKNNDRGLATEKIVVVKKCVKKKNNISNSLCAAGKYRENILTGIFPCTIMSLFLRIVLNFFPIFHYSGRRTGTQPAGI